MTIDPIHTSMDLTGMLLPGIVLLIFLVIAIGPKDFATGLAKGLKSQMGSRF